MSMYGAEEAVECDFPGCAWSFDRTENALNYLQVGNTNKAFCRKHADRLISEGVELLSLTDFHKANKEDEKAKWRKQKEAEQRDFVITLLQYQAEKKGFSCADIKKAFEDNIMGLIHGAAAKFILTVKKTWWDIEPKKLVKFPVFGVSFGFQEGGQFCVKANVAFTYRIEGDKIEFLDHVWGIPEGFLTPTEGNGKTLKYLLGEWFKQKHDDTCVLSESLRQRAQLPMSSRG